MQWVSQPQRTRPVTEITRVQGRRCTAHIANSVLGMSSARPRLSMRLNAGETSTSVALTVPDSTKGMEAAMIPRKASTAMRGIESSGFHHRARQRC